jgi:hypothetical protein
MFALIAAGFGLRKIPTAHVIAFAMVEVTTPTKF